MLSIRGVHKAYGALQALAGVDLEVEAGSRTAIVGPSGSGKTTLLRIVAGFEIPDRGQVVLRGQTLADGADAMPAHRRGIGYVPQDGALFPHLNIADNIGFGLPRHSPGRAARIAELMDMVALDRVMLARRPHELSGGQQQRVALARALALQPRLMLLDEPFSALDTGLRASTRKAAAQLLSAAGITTILVTHDQAEALSFADQVAVMRDGLLTQAGRPSDVYWRPRDAGIASFLGEALILPAQLAQGQARCALGRIAVDDPQRSGSAQIMLRPDQLALALPSMGDGQSEAPADAPLAEVVDIDFRGSEVDIQVRVLDGGSGELLQVRCQGRHFPARGAVVRVLVDGPAHVLD